MHAQLLSASLLTSAWLCLSVQVYGITPFRGSRRDETFENVVKAPLRFPAKPCEWACAHLLYSFHSCVPLALSQAGMQLH